MAETILHLGDNAQFQTAQKITALVSNPPYGGNFDTDFVHDFTDIERNMIVLNARRGLQEGSTSS